MNVSWEDFWNGIAHGFVVKHGGFEGDGSFYFKKRMIVGKWAPIISPTSFHQDFKTAVARYVVDLESAVATDPLRQN